MSIILNQSRVILGPLTTTFVPPPACTVAVGACKTCNVAWLGQECVATGAQDNTDCWPTTTEGALAPEPTLYGWGFYSPGLMCPQGYASACSATAGSAGAGWPLQFKLTAGETAVGCCPSGYRCDNLNGQTCILSAATMTVPSVSCARGTSADFDFITLPNRKINVFAPMIQINYQSSDQPTTSTITSTTGPGASNTQPSSTPPAPATDVTSGAALTSQTSTIPTGTPTAGISSAAIAGISIGVALLLIGAIAAAFILWRKKRRNPNNHGGGGGGGGGLHEMADSGMAGSGGGGYPVYPPDGSYASSGYSQVKSYGTASPPPPSHGDATKYYYAGAKPLVELGTATYVHEVSGASAVHEAPGGGYAPREMQG